MNLKAFSKSLILFYRYLLRRLRSGHATQVKLCKDPSQEKLSSQVLVCDVEGGLLRSSSTFPYFMLVALEGGGFLRGLLLLLLYPLVCLVSHEVGLRLMVMVAFCGLRKDGFRVGRAVLPKFFLEDVGLEGFEALRRGGKRMCASSMPRVMVESFLKEYLEVEVVLGRELKEFGGYYTGLMEEESKTWEGTDSKELFGGEEEMKAGIIGFGSYLNSHHHRLMFSRCKEVYLVSEAEKRRWHPLPRSAYPKPLIFHDGRIAFRPTPTSTLCMFLWLPIAIPLAISRAFTFIFLPFTVSTPILAFAGIYCRITTATSSSPPQKLQNSQKSHGQLYVCNHRTLLDPLYISGTLKRHVTATTYSISRISEFLSPVRTIRLTRNREADKKRMESVLKEGGDLAVCPEGTTCREPYLLRFSPLFAELISQEVVPVALKVRVDMFYGTTASGFKGLDPLYFLMNPYPCYEMVFMEKVSTSSIDGKEYCSSREVANYVQEKIGKVLGFECTALTRRDKYMMLAGNEGIIGRGTKGS